MKNLEVVRETYVFWTITLFKLQYSWRCRSLTATVSQWLTFVAGAGNLENAELLSVWEVVTLFLLRRI